MCPQLLQQGLAQQQRREILVKRKTFSAVTVQSQLYLPCKTASSLKELVSRPQAQTVPVEGWAIPLGFVLPWSQPFSWAHRGAGLDTAALMVSLAPVKAAGTMPQAQSPGPPVPSQREPSLAKD